MTTRGAGSTLCIERSFRDAFALRPGLRFLNHGSFGACPGSVLEHQAELRKEVEADPVHFFLHRYEPLLDDARCRVATFVGAPAADVVFVRNATTAVSAVLGNLDLAPGGEILATTHGYNACNNALRHLAARTGNTLRFVDVPFPLQSADAVVEALTAARTSATRLLLIDHITSPTGLVLPLERIVPAFEAAGVPVLVDGAHAPGQIPLSIEALGASWYTGNLHKWVCAPRGSAFLYVRPDRRAGLHPAVISHGYNSERSDRSRFQAEFDWTGTDDPTAWLSVPSALDGVPALAGATWEAVMDRNRRLALEGRARLLSVLGGEPPAPDAMIGSMVALPLPLDPEPPSHHPLFLSPLQMRLYERDAIQVPIIPFPAAPARVVRISAHLHNVPTDYDPLAVALLRETRAKR